MPQNTGQTLKITRVEAPGDPRAEEIKALCRDHAEDMIGVLAEVAMDPREKGAARVAAAKTLLERGFGAPERRVDQTVDHHIHDHRAEHYAALQALADRQAAAQALPSPDRRQHVEDAEFEEVGAALGAGSDTRLPHNKTTRGARNG